MNQFIKSSMISRAKVPKIQRIQKKLKSSIDERKIDQRPIYRLLKFVGIGAIIPTIIIFGWQMAVSLGYISSEFTSSPLEIGSEFIRLLSYENLMVHMGVSIKRALLGFVIGAGLGFVLGIITGLFRSAQYLLDPSFQVLRLVPNLAIVPLIILWFGFGEASKIAIIISGSFFPMYINVFTGIRHVDKKLYEVARVLNYSTWKILLRLIIPASLPHILNGIRISLAVSWISLVVAELVGSTSGIGFLINEAKQNLETGVIFVGIIIFAVIGKIIDSFMKIIEKRWLHWRDSYLG